ncbi:MAG: hypothetical protein MK209_08015 [Planctomycetes bacterium]|nr:hypothetical protein [Planctomycetota bacterium]
MAFTLGHVAVSASFDPTSRTNGKLDYLTEAEQLRSHDCDDIYTAHTFALNPDAPKDCAELCMGLRRLGFKQLRGVISGIELTNAEVSHDSLPKLIRCLEIALANGIDRIFCVAQEWPAGQRDADFDHDILPAFVGNITTALKQVSGIVEFGIEPLIPAEQQHVNTLGKARRLADACNAELGDQNVYPVPDTAHLYGLVPREQWPSVTAELIDAIDRDEVPYAHLSIPETRTDRIMTALESGDLPQDALQAILRVQNIDTEAFNPRDRFLDALRERVPRFAHADPSGWTEDLRFENFVEAARYLRRLIEK